MVRKGDVYHHNREVRPVKISILIWLLKISALVLSLLGGGFILIAVVGLVFVYMPLALAETKYAFSKTQLSGLLREFEKRNWEFRQADQKQKLNLAGKPADGVFPDWVVPDPDYSIYIPKIYARSKVVGSVDVNNPKEYLSALKKGVAEAAGLSHPGELGTTFLFAHSVGTRVDFARYNAVFYLLDKLTYGDTVEVVYKGKLFKYRVVEREILSATDVKYLVPQNLAEKMVLQTCYPPGTTWKRLVVVATRI